MLTFFALGCTPIGCMAQVDRTDQSHHVDGTPAPWFMRIGRRAARAVLLPDSVLSSSASPSFRRCRRPLLRRTRECGRSRRMDCEHRWDRQGHDDVVGLLSLPRRHRSAFVWWYEGLCASSNDGAVSQQWSLRGLPYFLRAGCTRYQPALPLHGRSGCQPLRSGSLVVQLSLGDLLRQGLLLHLRARRLSSACKLSL